jgi:hypothetical protein
MSESNSSLYWVGGIGTGLFMSGMSAGGMWLLENKVPTPKTIGRDFILGSILFFILLQLIPDSMSSLVAGIIAFIVPNLAEAVNSSMPEVIENVVETLTSTVAPMEEMEVRVGVPRF